eukprot:TRINITY_DN4359_c0_g1_i1.p2 TRINITY_DN4359_c0_g1~~TRINITY_DN4359_c0_g1_i1.p2  ORF type:complete len:730 (+),score=345.05 TRINITY_DN4359_c0_g1_i1:65-2254(+)
MEDYEKLYQIGQGGQGRVHKVRNRKDRKLYALKQIICRDPHEMNFALHEIKVLTNVKHANIIGFNDFFVHKDRHDQYSICLSMELCECGDFSDRIKDARRRKYKFEESRIRKWVVQMAAAMNYLHEQDYIHRDIKPTNIFFTADDNVRLGDFGLSRRCDEVGRKTVVGTPYYFAPELLLRQRYTNKVDLWGLGIIILELCTLRERPINSQLLQGDRVLRDVEMEIQSKGYSPRLAQLCSSLMAKDPRNRPAAKDVLMKWASESERELYGLSGNNAVRPRSKSGGAPLVAGNKEAKEENEQLMRRLQDKDDEVKRLRSELQQLKMEKDKPDRAPLQEMTNKQGRGDAGHKPAARHAKGFVPIKTDGDRHRKNVIKVSPGQSIQAAIDAASPGDAIVIEPGTYSKPINVNKNVTLTAADHDRRPVIQVEDRTVVTLNSTAELEYLVIRQRKSSDGDGKWVAADFRSGSAKMRHCDLSSHGGACITIHKTADPLIQKCSIHDGAQAGVYLFDGAKGVLEHNDIHNNTYAALLLKRGAQPVVRHNKIRDGRDTGVFICHDSHGTIHRNEIFNNGGSGVVVKAGGLPTISENHIHSNTQAGVFLCDRGGGNVIDNEISNNVKAGVLIKTQANPVIKGNTIRGGKETGVYCFENGKGVVRENRIHGNQNAGVLVTSGGHLTIEKNTIQGNKYEGIWVCNNGEAMIADNDLTGNAKGALDIDDSCKALVTLRDNKV